MEEHIPGFGYSQVVRTCIALTLGWLVGMCREVERGREEEGRKGARKGESSWADVAVPEQVIQCNYNIHNNTL